MDSHEAIRRLHQAFDAGRVEATRHFWDELRDDGFFSADVRSAVANITQVRELGTDETGHPKFEITGESADGRLLSLICAFKVETNSVLLITVYENR